MKKDALQTRCLLSVLFLLLQGCAYVPSTKRKNPARGTFEGSRSSQSNTPQQERNASRALRLDRPFRGHRGQHLQRENSRSPMQGKSYRLRHLRPGLGTAYGESLYAPVEQVRFSRRSSRPDSLLKLHYNNPKGVHAMARYFGKVPCCRRASSVTGAGVSVRITDAHGRSLYGMRAGGRVWIMGQHGRRYRIQIRNRTALRMEVVISVDGLDAIDGRRGSSRKRGYILMPYRTVWVDGFRRSYSHVAAFRFSSVQRSYAARTSGSQNVGVIGVAVFSEASSRHNRREIYRRLLASPFSDAP